MQRFIRNFQYNLNHYFKEEVGFILAFKYYHFSERSIFMSKTQNMEYLLSVHYLKKLREKGFITYEQYDEIDRLNRISFLKGQGQKSA